MLGTDNPNAIMTDETVTALRRDYVSGMSRPSLAAKYGLSVQSVNDFTSGRSWPHLLGKGGSPTISELKATARKNTKPGAILTPEIVHEIRSALSLGALGIDLASKYGVHKATISDIRRRKIWADV